MPLSADNTEGLHVSAYRPVWRVGTGVLVAISRASLPLIGVALLTTESSVSLAVLVRALAICALLPALAAWLIERAFTMDLEVRATELVLQGRGLRMEIPRMAITAIVPWTVPLPGPGFALRMQSGRRFGYGLQAADTVAVLSALAASAATQHPILVYAHAKRSAGCWSWYHLLTKFVLFALLPTAVWFYAHQHIAYGGLLGQYYLEGLGPYLRTFFISWALVTIYLLLYASVWRALAEGVALVAACVAPARAMLVRRVVELACRFVYYLGVPVLTLVPFLS